MKKALLLFCIFAALGSQAQNYWTEYATSQPTADTGVSSISIVDDFVTWLNMACGIPNCTAIRRYTKTTDGGFSWNSAAIDLGPESTNLRISNISGVSDSVAYVSVYPIIGVATAGGIWKTTDGGSTWIRQNSAAFSDPDSHTALVHFWNANDGVAMGAAVDGWFEIYTTSNGGALWTRVASAAALVPVLENEYMVTNNFTVTGNTIWAMTNFGRLLKSTDKGLHWTVSQTPVTDGFFTPDFGDASTDMAFTDQNNGLLLTNDFELYHTSDGGTTWDNVPTTIGTMRNFGISAVPDLPQAYITVGEDLNGQRGSSFTLDAGLTWTSINDEVDVSGGTISMRSQHMGFAGGFSISPAVSGIFRWNGSGCLCMDVSDFSTGESISASPNPTSGMLNIRASNISRIVLSDMLGKEISATDYTGVDGATVSLDKLTNGMYMISISTDKATSVRKVIKQ